MINPKSLKKFGLLGSLLYVSQFIPIACLYEALSVFMRQRGASLEAIGYQGVLIIFLLPLLWLVSRSLPENSIGGDALS
ncbi:hypothetical protein QUA56_25315 [Microcoleus sp. N3A4]|uniref:hypothetical protein n=1 Tax=Microcoleus sp. N3A4 TaxID=3055379 RepID=UPI002FD629E7